MLVEPEVIERAQAGDADAFNEIVRRYRHKIMGTAYRILGGGQDVEDVAQEVFVRFYRSIDQLRTTEVFEPWLYRLTVNAVYDHLRRRRRRTDTMMSELKDEQVHAIDAAASGSAFADEVRASEARELVGRLWERISEEDRILLTLKEVQGLSLKELEQIYEVNTNALKVRLFRARKRALEAFHKMKAEDERVLQPEALEPSLSPA